MKPIQILDLMTQIDCTEDFVQIDRWGKQCALLQMYAWDRKIAIHARRTGSIAAALTREAKNDHRYGVVAKLAKIEGY